MSCKRSGSAELLFEEGRSEASVKDLNDEVKDTCVKDGRQGLPWLFIDPAVRGLSETL